MTEVSLSQRVMKHLGPWQRAQSLAVRIAKAVVLVCLAFGVVFAGFFGKVLIVVVLLGWAALAVLVGL